MEIDKNNLIQKMSHMLHWSDPVIYSKHVPAMRRSDADTAEHKLQRAHKKVIANMTEHKGVKHV